MIPIACYLPKKIVTNDDFKSIYDDWDSDRVYEQTGIKSRHYVEDNEISSDLAKKAIDKLINEYNIDKNSIDMLICVTETPDNMLPSTACKLQHICELPATCAAFDMNHGCAGFTYGIMAAKSFILSGMFSNIIVVTVDTLSRFTPVENRGIKVLIGDAASASFISKDNIHNIGDFIYGTDGSGYDDIIIKHDNNIPALCMEGVNVFSFAINNCPDMINNILEQNNTVIDNIDHVILHQANKTILEYIKKRLKLPADKFYINMEETGNTAGSTIPIAIKYLEEHKKLEKGQNILVLGFGVGLSHCGTIIKW